MPNGKELILKPLNTTHKEVLKATYNNRVRWYGQLVEAYTHSRDNIVKKGKRAK